MAAYAPDSRTDGETVFQRIEASGPGASLFAGFVTYLNNIRASADEIRDFAAFLDNIQSPATGIRDEANK